MTLPAAHASPSAPTELTGLLDDRVAIVTGASAGIGLAIAKELVRLGARVVINARRADRLDAVAAELNHPGRQPRCVAMPGDCAQQPVIEAMLDAARRAFAADADAVIVNAGRGLAGSALTSDPAQWEEMLRTNIIGAARLMRTAAQRMLASLEGDPDPLAWRRRPRDIVVIGSIVGRHVSPFSSMYGGTKFAIHAVTEGLRRELAPKGVRVSLAEPGFVISEFQGVAGYTPDWFSSVKDRIGPVLQPEDVARAVAFGLCQPAHVHLSDWILRPTRQDYP